MDTHKVTVRITSTHEAEVPIGSTVREVLQAVNFVPHENDEIWGSRMMELDLNEEVMKREWIEVTKVG